MHRTRCDGPRDRGAAARRRLQTGPVAVSDIQDAEIKPLRGAEPELQLPKVRPYRADAAHGSGGPPTCGFNREVVRGKCSVAFIFAGEDPAQMPYRGMKEICVVIPSSSMVNSDWNSQSLLQSTSYAAHAKGLSLALFGRWPDLQRVS